MTNETEVRAKRGRMSKRKGKTGELELAKQFTEAGFPARRTQQFSGAEGTSDVTVADLPELHIEGKRAERPLLVRWLEQARSDAAKDGKVPVVCWRRNGDEWVAIIPLSHYLELHQSTFEDE